jgi:hypothetical protein
MGSYRVRDLNTGEILGTSDTDDEFAAHDWATKLAGGRREFILEKLVGAGWEQKLKGGRVKKHEH